MALPVQHLCVIPGDGSPRAPAMKYSQLRSGLWTAKHKKQMREAIWLYGWLHSRADRRTGVIARYTHAEAAADFEEPERTVQRYFKRLVDAGYIVATHHSYHVEVAITNYKPDVADSTNLSTLKPVEDRQIGRAGSTNLSSRVDESVDLITSRGIQRDQSVCADAPRAVKKCKRKPATQPFLDAFYEARKVDPAKVGPDLRKALDGRLEKIPAGYVPDDLRGCTAYVLSDRWYYDKPLTALLTAVVAALPTWVADGRPEKQRGRDNGHRAEPPVRASRSAAEVLAELMAPPPEVRS